jgi:ZIP family zinc transporter
MTDRQLESKSGGLLEQAGRRRPIRIGLVGLAFAIVVVLRLWASLWARQEDTRELGVNDAGAGSQIRAELTIERTNFRPGVIDVFVRNGSRTSIRISQVAINQAYWTFVANPSEIARLEVSRVEIPYPWEEGEPIEVLLVTSDGQTVRERIDFPREDLASGFWHKAPRYVLVGTGMGIVPISLGLLALPMMRRSRRLTSVFLAFTLGVLAAVGVEAFAEALDTSRRVAPPLSAKLLIWAAAASAFGLIAWVSKVGRRQSLAPGGKPVSSLLPVTLAVAIGLHNFGEGLSVAGAEISGATTASVFLAIGFAVHNVTEGFAIAAGIAEAGAFEGGKAWPLERAFWLVMLAGIPATAGLLVGGQVPSPIFIVGLLGVGIGSVASVFVEVLDVLRARSTEASTEGMILAAAGGLVSMYLTSLLVSS